MIYEFECHACKIVFEKEYSMKSVPDRAKCPDCAKLSNRHYGSNGIIFKGDWHTNRTRARRLNNDKGEQGKLANALVDWTKRSLDGAHTNDFYRRPELDYVELAKQGKAKKLSDAEVIRRGDLAQGLANSSRSDGHEFKVKKH